MGDREVRDKFKITIKASTPISCEFRNKELVEYFRKYFNEKKIQPWKHQAEAFQKIIDGKTVFLVAGTGSGKTLAVALPIFFLIKKNKIKKVMFVYPTRALIEDQMKVLEKLCEVFGFGNEVMGEIKGGMNRGELLENLSKRIILATPDEIYWFFRKNVKYSSFLIFGLSLVDTFVFDEIHLFRGLSLQALLLFMRRIQVLDERIGKKWAFHHLSATPQRRLMNEAQSHVIKGEGKGGEITLVAMKKKGYVTDDVTDILEKLGRSINSKSKILVVLNSASNAHRLFYNLGVGFPPKDLLKMVKTNESKERLKNLIRIRVRSIPKDLREKYCDIIFDFLNPSLQEIDYTGDVKFKAEKATWMVSRHLWFCYRLYRKFCETKIWEGMYRNFGKPIKDVMEWYRGLEAKGDQIKDAVSKLTDDIGKELSSEDCSLKEFSLCLQMLCPRISRSVIHHVESSIRVKAEDVPHLTVISYVESNKVKERMIPLSFIERLESISEEDREKLRERTWEHGNVDYAIRRFKLVDEKKVPLIRYSGSMNQKARKGLVRIFDEIGGILLSTSAVEVGVDFDCNILITEECDCSSFIQRLGRVARRSEKGKCFLLLSPDSYDQMRSEFRKKNVEREEFNEHVRKVLPFKHFMSEWSEFVDLIHYNINEQIGVIGRYLNGKMFPTQTEEFSTVIRKLRSNNINLRSYGLRQTLPGVGLKGGVSKDLFYILKYLDSNDLFFSASPFKIASSDKSFDSIIFEKSKYEEIIPDIDRILKMSKILLVIDGGIRLIIKPSIASEYDALYEFKDSPDLVKELELMPDLSENEIGWLMRKRCSKTDGILLLFGDLFFRRVRKSGEIREEVVDRYRIPIHIPDQMYILMFKGYVEKVKKELSKRGMLDLEEIHLIFNKYGIIIEKFFGASYIIYNMLMEVFK
ncbi:MAG: DEAD/DEAH box helicase [Candidatus Bathyarchaeia archaeon]|nr:DEAD/DEAH box helicase [Candidatus Bathyarchaeia archaeon]